MWLLNANFNCTCTQNLRKCPTFSHCALREQGPVRRVQVFAEASSLLRVMTRLLSWHLFLPYKRPSVWVIPNSSHKDITSAKKNMKFDLFQKYVIEEMNKMKGNEFSGVTLVYNDAYKFGAHKLILSSSSEVFKLILINERQPHPLI